MFFYSYLCEKYYKPIIVQYYSASQGALVVKNLPANAGDVRDMGLIPELESSPGEEGMATHSSILAWRMLP